MNGSQSGCRFRCPVCGGALLARPAEKRFVCGANHSFDIARQGYVNLLPPQKHTAHAAGDSPEMVRARSAFLDGGYYEGFSDGVNALCRDALLQNAAPNGKSAVLADAGCGEGYYTVRLFRSLTDAGFSVSAAGFDVSRDAVLHGAKRASAVGCKDAVQFAAASLFSMPLEDGSVHGVINLFAPTAEEEFARVLCGDGFLLLAVPAEDHLWGLKTALYDVPYPNEVRRDSLSHFTLTEVRRISYMISLRSNEDIRSLFSMTPYFWKTSPADRDKLYARQTLETQVSFDLLLYRKRKEAFSFADAVCCDPRLQ